MSNAPSTVANPQLISVTSGSVVAVVAPAACYGVTVQQQQGSDPPSHSFKVYQSDLVTQIGSTALAGGTNYVFPAPSGTFFNPGQTVGGIELPSSDSGTGLFSVFAHVAPGGRLPIFTPDSGSGGTLGAVPAAAAGSAALGLMYSSAGLVPGPVRAIVTLTTAQLKALQTTAIPIIAAPPAGYAIFLGKVIFNYKYLTAAYTLGNADNIIQLEYTGKSTSLLQAACAGFVDQTVNGIIPGSSPLTTDLASTNVSGLGVEAKLTGTAAALTVGAGTVTITADYVVTAVV